jgi:hypothetical protein
VALLSCDLRDDRHHVYEIESALFENLSELSFVDDAADG